VKRFVYVLVLVAISMIVLQTQSVLAANSKSDSKLVGSWKMTKNSVDSAGAPCPFVPEVFDFYKDKTVVLSNFGPQHLPYTTSVTNEEKEIIIKKMPDFKGKDILLIKPNPNMDWTNTPMVYAYSINNNELTLSILGYSPATFAKSKK